MNPQQVSEQLAGYTFNLNFPTGGSSTPTQPLVDPTETEKRKQQQMYVAGGILAVLVIVIVFMALKKKN